MRRLGRWGHGWQRVLIPIIGLLLAGGASGALILIQQREGNDRAAQLKLASVKNELTQLQGLPWQVENPRYGTPRQIRRQITASEHVIRRQLAELLRSSPPPALRSAAATVKTNFAAQEPIFKLGLAPGGWNTPATMAISQAQTTSVAATLWRLNAAGAVYAHRAEAAQRTSRIGVVGALLVLLAGFLFYFVRSDRVRAGLHVQAKTDALTGLSNRTAFAQRVGAWLERSTRGATVLFIDLDGFKDMNDLFGHRGGDDVLREVAVRLERNTRPGDLCARLGGDEFALVMPDADPDAAQVLAHRIANALAEPFSIGGRTARLGASIGIAATSEGVGFETLIHWADLAMYAAKTNGDGRIAVFDSRMLAGEPSRVLFEQQLAAATHAGELAVHYQPVVSLGDGRCMGVEALARWQHPERGLVLPDEFVPIAERTGAIVDIGNFVLRQACLDAAAWQQVTGQALNVYVNVSGRQLSDDHILETVTAALADSGLRADLLVLELTENSLLHSPGISGRLEALVAHGVRIAIDDFGTGYASLTTLRSLPIDTVKIDKSFVARALESGADRAVVAAIVQMAARLGLQTIGEGVERHDQQAFLKTMGADSAQGFFYRQPTDAEGFLEWLTEEHTSPRTDAGVYAITRELSA